MQPPNESAALHLKLARLGAALRTACYEALSARALASYGTHADDKASADAPQLRKPERADTKPK